MSHNTRSQGVVLTKTCSVNVPKLENSALPSPSVPSHDEQEAQIIPASNTAKLVARRRSVDARLTRRRDAISSSPRQRQLLSSEPVGSLRQESDSDKTEDKKSLSPTLARLKSNFSGTSLEETQKLLMRKHHEAKNNIDKLCVGGGISLWPDMEDMRLSRCETVLLFIWCLLLCGAAIWLFYTVHGQLLTDIQFHHTELSSFRQRHPLLTGVDNSTFASSVISWHSDYRQAVFNIHETFDVSLLETSTCYNACVVVYVVAIATLLYYLWDNVLAKSRLTPRRIRQWVSLLVVTATWTALVIRLLVAAVRLDLVVKDNVYYLNERLGDLILLPYDLSLYRHVLSYWTTQCLLSTSPSVLSIMGLVAVGDVAYYLQYYSLPVLTALLLPVVKLVWSMADVYAVPKAR